MIECRDCEYRGYSPEFCAVHVKSCKAGIGAHKRELPRPFKVGASAVAWAGMGVAAVCVGATAVSLVGSVTLLHIGLLKLGGGAGLAGGGVGLLKGLSKDRGKLGSEQASPGTSKGSSSVEKSKEKKGR